MSPREIHPDCERDCPDCCVDGQEIPVGTRFAAAVRSGAYNEATR